MLPNNKTFNPKNRPMGTTGTIDMVDTTKAEPVTTKTN
jgi:hypothetical protein